MKDIFNFWKIFFYNWIHDILGLFLGFFLTFFIMVVWLLFKSDNALIFPSAIMLTIIRNGMYNISRTLNEFKRVGFLTRLDMLPVSKLKFYLSLVSFNSFIVLIALFWIFLSGIIIFPDELALLKQGNWWIISFAILLATIFSTLLGICLATLIDNTGVIQIISLLLYFLPMYLLGLAVPLESIYNYPVLVTLTYLIPYRYIFNVIQAGWINNLNMNYSFNDNGQEKVINLGYSNVWIPIVITIVLIGIMILILFFYWKIKKIKLIKYSMKINS